MSRASIVAAFVLIVASAATMACGAPPDKEIQQAQGAIDAARAVHWRVGPNQFPVDAFEKTFRKPEAVRRDAVARTWRRLAGRTTRG